MNMIKSLRWKFVLIATAAVIAIIAGVLGLINTITYIHMTDQVNSVLSYISQNSGRIPRKVPVDDSSWFNNTNWSDDTPEFSYQIRFFSVIVNPAGYVREINIKNIAAFTEHEAIEYAQTTVQKGKNTGFFKKDRASYAYMITKRNDGDFLIVIMDCTHDVDAVKAFMRYSLLVGIACVLLYIVILTALSKLPLKPFIRNMENQKRFITNAGHELKTPIAIISTNAEAIALINGKNQWTESILKQVKRLSNLINDLVMLSKMGERSYADLNITKFDLSETITTIVTSFQQMAKDQDKKLFSNIKAPIYIQSDAKCIYELVNILVDNAVKYCDDKGTIDIILRQNKKKTAIISVINDYAAGANIDYSRFFERFYRGDESHNSQKKGYGIGLSIAEELTELINGKINVSYTKGKIIFTVKINNSVL
ncbi:sensor histidine kinase [Pectinatus sottacetonis]|uniref:sensor histidine kinase n=1 Tax=Pectinatus sottacetonis TaxID=1002795 RepID=UPI0018C561A3|nr:HAMP domain-containing sensor histidine kinase [Pectinatus sottacetonis]